MKQIWKKVIGVLLMSICIFALSACGQEKNAETKEEVLDPQIESSLMQAARMSVEEVVVMDDVTIQTYLKSTDAFSVSAMQAWQGAKEELGAFIESGEPSVSVTKDITTITVPTKFENENANFLVTFDKEYKAMGMSVDVQYSMGTSMKRAALNTLMGLGIVFTVLIFLTFVISLFKYIPGIIEGKKKESEELAEKPAVTPLPEEELVNDGELVAVISAAIAASENTSTDSFQVRSIRKSNKKNWQRA